MTIKNNQMKYNRNYWEYKYNWMIKVKINYFKIKQIV